MRRTPTAGRPGAVEAARWRPSRRAVCYVTVFAVTAGLVLAPLVMLVLTSVNVGPIREPDHGITLLNFAASWDQLDNGSHARQYSHLRPRCMLPPSLCKDLAP
jgi:hypothetical protein